MHPREQHTTLPRADNLFLTPSQLGRSHLDELTNTESCIFRGNLLVVVCFYKALVSALEQTHCSRMRFYTSDYLLTARF